VKKGKYFIVKILFVVLGIVLIAYFGLSKPERNRYVWTENYRATNDQPYGTKFIQKLLESYRPWESFVVNEKKPLHLLLDTTQIKVKTNYVLIGNGFYFDDNDQQALLNFVSAGNDAFIAANVFSPDLFSAIYSKECTDLLQLTGKDTLAVNLNFYNSSLKNEKGFRFAYHLGKIDVPYHWKTLLHEVICDSMRSITPLGYIYPDQVNFFRVAYGKGFFYLHTNPLVFTNFFLVKPEKVTYASGVFSHLQGQSMIWDEFSKAQFIPTNQNEVNPLAYILQQDSLRYAWWLMLLSVLLYIFFAAKRKQRPIPVLQEKTNTSLEFVNVIAALYFQGGYYRDMARKRMKYFFYFIKTKYGLHLQQLTELHLVRLIEKSQVPADRLKIVATEFDRIEKQKYYDETMLVDLQNALEEFYKHCK
jgi:hypothetical protein